MKNQTSSQRILKWLRDNGIPLGALTSHDTAALLAAAEIANLWVRSDYGTRKKSAEAFALVVNQMQDTTMFMAYHAIAMVGDWGHRPELWVAARLPADCLLRAPTCKFGPRPNCGHPAGGLL
jgi:hypothetical protein